MVSKFHYILTLELPFATDVFIKPYLPTCRIIAMGKIRLKVVVLPYIATAREEAIAPWIEPCEEDLTLQALCDRLVETFADLHEGKG